MAFNWKQKFADFEDLPSGLTAACSGASWATGVASFLLTEGERGAGTQPITIKGGGDRYIGMVLETEPGSPGFINFPASDWDFTIRKVSGDRTMILQELYACRMDGGVVFSTIADDASIGDDMRDPGEVIWTVPGVGSANKNTDTIYQVWVFSSTKAADDYSQIIVEAPSITEVSFSAVAWPSTKPFTQVKGWEGEADGTSSAEVGADGRASVGGEMPGAADSDGMGMDARASVGGEMPGVAAGSIGVGARGDFGGAGDASAAGEFAASGKGGFAGVGDGVSGVEIGVQGTISFEGSSDASSEGDAQLDGRASLGGDADASADGSIGASGRASFGADADATADASLTLHAANDFEGQADGASSGEIGLILDIDIVLGSYESIADEVRTAAESALVGETEVYDNFPDVHPDGVEWVRLQVAFTSAYNIATGQQSTWRKWGYIRGRIHVPMESGSERAYQLADLLGNAFQGRDLAGILFFAASLYRRGAEGGYWIVDLEVPFYFDEVATRLAGSGADMPQFEDMGDTIRSRVKTLVEDAQSIYVLYDNFPDAHADGVKYVRHTIIFGEGRQTGMGGTRRWRTRGRSVKSVFVPMESGDEAALQLVDVIVAAFRSVTVSGVTFETPDVSQGRRSGPYWQVDVACPFYADEVA